MGLPVHRHMQFWDLRADTSGGKEICGLLCKAVVLNPSEASSVVKNPYQIPSCTSMCQEGKNNPNYSHEKKARYMGGLKTIAEWLATHHRCVCPLTSVDWMLASGCPIN